MQFGNNPPSFCYQMKKNKILASTHPNLPVVSNQVVHFVMWAKYALGITLGPLKPFHLQDKRYASGSGPWGWMRPPPHCPATAPSSPRVLTPPSTLPPTHRGLWLGASSPSMFYFPMTAPVLARAFNSFPSCSLIAEITLQD